MLAIGREKVKKIGKSGIISLQAGDSEAINFPDSSFDAITVAFGVRNFQDREKGLSEMLRVLTPGGKLVILEFSKPKQRLFTGAYNIYMKVVTPGIGTWISKNKEAYKYLSSSVKAFPEGETFLHILDKTGFTNTYLKRLSLGICTIYCGRKTLG
jgi:demethylmenaquinone methyltransferase / 2-methoxy-6-polyprenyl-1,4-benzoquinol methylase